MGRCGDFDVAFGGGMAEDCIFCRIASGEIPSDILYRDDRAFVIRDINPRAPVHLLVMPVEHFTHLTNMSEETSALVGHLFFVAQRMARREGVDESGYRLAVNQRDDAGQDIDHLHVHLLGGRRLGPVG